MPEPTFDPPLTATDTRSDFPIFQQSLPNGKPVVYLDSAASAQKPREVIQKESEVYERYYANAYRGVYHFGAVVDEELESTRSRVAHFINAAEPAEIIYTSGTTMSINLVAQAWGRRFLEPGDEILLSVMEHHANLVPWQQVARDRGAVLKWIPLTDDFRVDMAVYEQLLSPRTKLVAMTAMSNVLGTLPPLAEMARAAHDHGAVILVDAAQSVPHLPTNVVEADFDFLAFSGHKMYGPTGIGVLYGRRELLEAMDPFLAGGHMISQVFRDHSEWAEIPAKFEAGTIPIAQAIALGTAVDYVSRIGLEAIALHEHELSTYLHESLLQFPGLKIYGPPVDQKGAIASFTMEGTHPEDLAQLLDRCGVAVRHGHHCTMPLHDLLGLQNTVRASLGVYSTRADVDALVEGLHFARRKLRVS